jgi:hypothetical protein
MLGTFIENLSAMHTPMLVHVNEEFRAQLTNSRTSCRQHWFDAAFEELQKIGQLLLRAED